IHMGRLETLVEIPGRDVSLQFEAASDDVINVLRRNTATIHRFLADIGYKFANSTFATKKSATTVETALLSLLESRRGRGGINMII
ncbi:MAG: hypothetical protein GX823_02760, partial [Clostridiales bacterium]|nr:hypothetical protein [Clostridiales bacterium]